MPAQKHFNTSRGKETAVGRLEDLIAVLDNANSTALSYTTHVEGNDADNTMSEHKKEAVQNESTISCTGLPDCNFIVALSEIWVCERTKLIIFKILLYSVLHILTSGEVPRRYPSTPLPGTFSLPHHSLLASTPHTFW
jgi:hypothetical protein